MAQGERRIVQAGRAKAYRPLPEEERRLALRDGLAAYERGDYFLAHEILEPAWMGAEDIAERELLQGIIKLAAAYVHDVRGNPAGVAKNLRGSLERVERGAPAGPALGIDAEMLAGAIREQLAAVGDGPAAGARRAPVITVVAPPPPEPPGR